MLHHVFDELFHLRVALEGMILKPNMIVAGLKAADRGSPQQVGERTAAVLKACHNLRVPVVARGVPASGLPSSPTPPDFEPVRPIVPATP